MIIEQLATLPKDLDSWTEIIGYMVQSISREERDVMEFLIDLWAFHNRKGYLTDAQKRAILNILDRFIKAAKAQFPDKFDVKDLLECHKEPVRKGKFTVYEGGKK